MADEARGRSSQRRTLIQRRRWRPQLHEGYEAYALSFDYGQRHRIEIEAARRIARRVGAKEHRIAKIDMRYFQRLGTRPAMSMYRKSDRKQKSRCDSAHLRSRP